MAHDGSIPSQVEAAIVAKLIVRVRGSDALFKTAAVWTGQCAAETGGGEAMQGLVPFAFVGYAPGAGITREGDHDLSRRLQFSILVGQVCSAPGVARFGDDTHVGTNLLEQEVITALDHVSPEVSGVDDLEYMDTEIILDRPNVSALRLIFEARLTGPISA